MARVFFPGVIPLLVKAARNASADSAGHPVMMHQMHQLVYSPWSSAADRPFSLPGSLRRLQNSSHANPSASSTTTNCLCVLGSQAADQHKQRSRGA